MCCSNCSLYPVRILRDGGHGVIGFWYNPNIHPLDEYDQRLGSLKRLADGWKIDVIYNESDPADYFRLFLPEDEVKDVKDAPAVLPGIQIPPSPDRCRACYTLRLEKAAARARNEGLDGFTTTLLISPYQDFEEIIRTGRGLAEQYNVMFYEEDFRPYFRDAMNLAKEMGLYRQKYCGCIYSLAERQKRIAAKAGGGV
jgi:hypothetical protein